MQAILGFRKIIKHLDGRDIVIEEDEITQPNSIKEIEGEGMPFEKSTHKGNLYVKINVHIPDFNTDELNQL